MGSKFALKPLAKKLVRTASRELIENHFLVELRPHERERRWLRQSNRYRVNCTKQYGKDLKATPAAVDHAGMIAYTAASAPAHISDAWSLLGRALDSTLRQDTYTAIHLAYYAELRAAMGLLASEGVGILLGRHPTVQRGGMTEPLPYAKTHDIVGPCLRHWSGLRRAGDLLGRTVKPEGIELSTWLSGLGVPANGRAVAQQWLRAWGLDLTAVEDDHHIRNLASYRPSEFRLPFSLPGSQVVDFVEQIWRLFEPSGSGRFPTLERLLLRRALRRAGRATPTENEIASLGIAPSEANKLSIFLGKSDDPIPLIEAEARSAIEDERCHIQIISRAALLLYVATGSVADLLGVANYTHKELGFWWKRIGVTRGIWDNGAIPDAPTDIWADIEASLDDAQRWRVSSGPNASLRDWRRSNPVATTELGGCELIGMWGLTP